MIVALIGCSCSGKSTIMKMLHETRGFGFLRNAVTRPGRTDEMYKISYTDLEFDKSLERNELILQNKHFKYRYAYLRNDFEKAILTHDEFYMLDFGIENISQFDQFESITKVIIIPESCEFLKKNILKSGREERESEILANFKSHYSHLKEGYNKGLNSLIVKNRENNLPGVVTEIINFMSNSQNRYLSVNNIFKSVRLKMIIENLKSLEPSNCGLMAYSLITKCINEVEDEIWGKNFYFPPRTFLNGSSSNRIYTIFPESFFKVPMYSGVTLLLSKRELIFISRFGAIEGQLKDSEDKFGEKIHFSERRNNVYFEKQDSFGDGVWVPKNR
jgi:guanylate kinase